MKLQKILLIALIAIVLVGFGVSLAGNASTYGTFTQAQSTGKTLHISGTWVDREQVVEEANRFQFFIQDTLQKKEWVTYYDPKPSNFDQADKIVLIGRYESDGFVAKEIVTKCPSKYEATEPTLE